MEYSYYPGCSLKSSSKDYAESVKQVSDKLGITLIELSNWACCGASVSHIPEESLSLALPALTIAEADKYSRDIVASCAACFNRLKSTHLLLGKYPEKKIETEKLIGKNLSVKINVKHFLEVLFEEVKDWDSIIIKKLKGLKVACYYGCLLTRPNDMIKDGKSEDPRMMDNLMEKLGAASIDWPFKTECCGTSFGLSKPEVVLKLSGRILRSAKKSGAECIVVACPLCHSNLDLRQSQIEKYNNLKFDLPVFYFPELAALALGIDYRNLLLDKHIVDPMPLLRRKDLI
ncbi:MAG: CoB--CoM heterodisulfide reductase iron-sulfur subunit B family protein [bacterium]|nr:CoB--CoM heterodisulfide reductase iron-sulfur subunit B family protein [bacterium]